MSDEKFTQGEWGVFGNKNMLKHYIVLNPQKDVKEQKIIADVFCCGGDVGANAALIAAAPDLYNALVDLVGKSRPGWREVNVSKETIENALKALKKARGEE